jgi:hypothetical protein
MIRPLFFLKITLLQKDDNVRSTVSASPLVKGDDRRCFSIHTWRIKLTSFCWIFEAPPVWNCCVFSALFDVTIMDIYKRVQRCINVLVTVKFVIVNTVSSAMLWNALWLFRLASAGTNEMSYRERNKRRPDPPRVNTEKNRVSSLLASEDAVSGSGTCFAKNDYNEKL